MILSRKDSFRRSRIRSNAVRIIKSILTSVESHVFLLKSGSCVAFANMAAIETCFKKKTGVFGEFSEAII